MHRRKRQKNDKINVLIRQIILASVILNIKLTLHIFTKRIFMLLWLRQIHKAKSIENQL